MSLPLPNKSQAYCDVSALEAGHLDIFEHMIIVDGTPGKANSVPSLSLLLRHSTNKKKIVFDLGIKKDWKTYTPANVKLAIDYSFNIHVEQDVAESLAKGGLSPDDVDYVCLSHCHWDHIGDTKLFKKSQFLVGSDCQKLFKSAYPEDPTSQYSSDTLPADGRTTFYDTSAWGPVGVFPRALDFFGDGSLYIVDAAGHLVGHVNILARTSPDGGWIYLAGDSAHHRKLITLESTIAVIHTEHGPLCAHEDKDKAEAHIKRINDLMKNERVRVLLSHDDEFYSTNKDGQAFWPGIISSL